MAITFTPEQQKVIDLHNRNILVSAAAGSGKTAVLVERILRMVCDEEQPVDIDRLLIVTFTNAAAAEMRERISLGIARNLALRPQSTHLQRQSTLLHNALITTIDSFCLFLIRNHFNEIDLDPAFRVADEGEIRLMQQDVLKELLEEKFASGEEDFLYCVEYFCPGGRENVLEQYILNLYHYAQSNPWPMDWLKARKSDYRPTDEAGLEHTDYGVWLIRHLQAMLSGCAGIYDQLLDLCEQPDGPYMYAELAEKEKEMLAGLAELTSLEEFAGALSGLTFGRLPSKKDDTVNPVKREYAKALRGQVKDTLQDLAARFFSTSLSLAACQAGECSGPVNMLVSLAEEFTRRLLAGKQEKKLMDFSDMEHYALDILLDREGEEVHPSQVALEYRQHFAEILIDEYQDSNLVQEYLLSAVSGEGDGRYNRFMVGDVKQSIYKFRLARPELFMEKYLLYAPDGDNQLRIDLSKNFRSRCEVVDTVNGVFSNIMSQQFGGIAYDDRAALYAGAAYPENPACTSELILVERPEDGDALAAKQAEARAIAQRIRELKTSFQVTDKDSGELRPARYSDMVILLRTNSGWDEEFRQVLEKEGIPVYITSRTGYFAASEVQELLQFLRVLDNPRQDIALFGVLRSVFGGFSEEEIAQIRGGEPAGSLYESLKLWAEKEETAEKAEKEEKAEKAETAEEEEKTEKEKTAEKEEKTEKEKKAEKAETAEEVDKAEEEKKTEKEMTAEKAEKVGETDQNGTGDVARKVHTFLEKMNVYRSYTVYMPIRELLEKIVGDADYLSYVSALPAGSKRRANVEMLFTKASDFEKTSYYGLFHFIRYIEQLEKYDVDFGEVALLDENADVVRIMSIHKSKGLEFPVVFAAGLTKRFNMQDANQSLIIDMDLGLGVDYVDPKRRIRNRTLRRAVLARKMREDNLAEELRVLYVAMTRPKEKLILTGCLEKAGEKFEMRRDLGSCRPGYSYLMEAGSYLDFLLPVIQDAHIEVKITDIPEMVGTGAREQITLAERKEVLRSSQELADEEELSRLKDRFTYRYPYSALEKLYTKTTVSELKIAAMAEKDEAAFHTFEEQEIIPYIPRYRREKEEITGPIRGNAFHKIMELLDFVGFYNMLSIEVPKQPEEFAFMLEKEEYRKQLYSLVKEQLARFTVEGRLTEEYRNALNVAKLVRFLSDPIACRMRNAQERGQLYREQPFVYGVSAGRLGEQFPDEETVLIQGIIDAFFVEDTRLVLLDYKTDKVKNGEELWNRYEAQLDYYEEALCRLMGMPVGEKVLYSFSLEKCVRG